jgi:hypothetical protein
MKRKDQGSAKGRETETETETEIRSTAAVGVEAVGVKEIEETVMTTGIEIIEGNERNVIKSDQDLLAVS